MPVDVSQGAGISKRVLITGGSIAGNTLAWWMEKAGYDVVVVERGPNFRDGGQSVDLRGSACTVFERMGLIGKVDASGTGKTAWTFVDEDGDTVAAFRVADIGPDGPTAELEILSWPCRSRQSLLSFTNPPRAWVGSWSGHLQPARVPG